MNNLMDIGQEQVRSYLKAKIMEKSAEAMITASDTTRICKSKQPEMILQSYKTYSELNQLMEVYNSNFDDDRMKAAHETTKLTFREIESSLASLLLVVGKLAKLK